MTNNLPTDTVTTYVPPYSDWNVDDNVLRQQLTHTFTDTGNAINSRQIGYFENVESLTGQQFFGTTPQKKRQTFRKAFPFEAIAAGASITIAHGVTQATVYTHIYGGAVTATPDFRPIPHASVTANANIEVIVDGTNITINNGAGGPNITSGIIALEYLKE